MKLPENDYQILKLTPMFYEKYLVSSHSEILQKNIRALQMQSHAVSKISSPFYPIQPLMSYR